MFSHELSLQIPTKLPGFYYTTWVIIVYLAGYDTTIPNPLSYLDTMQKYNIAE